MDRLAPASRTLRLLREYKSDLFRRDVLLELQTEHARLVEEKIIDDLRDTSERSVLEAIEGLIARPVIGEAIAYFDTLPRTTRSFLFERFFYFEHALIELGDRELEFPTDFESFLRQGLIDAWNAQRSRGLFF